MKKILIIIALVLVVIFGLSLMKDSIIRSIVTVKATQVTGAPVHMDSLSLGIFKQSIVIKGFKMYNPAGFPHEVLVNIPIISVDFDLADILKKQIHLRQITVDIKEVGIIKDEKGKLNVDSLKVSQKAESPEKQMPMKIDLLTLSIGRVVVSEYTKAKQPMGKVYDINIKNKQYKDISSANHLVALILVEAMRPAAIKSAGIYGAASLLGVAFLPAGVAANLVGKDSSKQDFKVNFDKVYSVCLDTINKIGKVSEQDKASGIIKANVDENDVVVKIIKISDKSSEITVSARKYFFPKPESAAGILYQIEKNLK